MIRRAPAVLIGAALLAAGCAAGPGLQGEAAVVDRPSANFDKGDRYIANGFVEALVQLPGFDVPGQTTLAFERQKLADNALLSALETELEAQGYGVRVSSALAETNAVSHVAQIDADGDTTHTVSFGDVQMRRRFSPTGEEEWGASSSLFIRGADASGVRIGTSTPTVLANGVAVQQATRSSAQVVARDDAAPRNVAELGGSNYAGVFEGYIDIDEAVLVFDDDSMMLGADNKKRIQRTVAAVDPELDLFSIIGCSFGKTAIENGNEVLATGRANRVREALLFAGVSSERILDEGCWAGAPAENFPGRGVVLTVKRPRG